MQKKIDTNELEKCIALNFERMSSQYYDIDHIFPGDATNWPGDKEGRALLAFVCHYKMNKKQVPCMKLMIDKIPEMSNGRMFFGPDPSEVLFEQQLSGHSWYLRGLCEYYEQFNDQRALEYLNKTFEKLYLPTMGRFEGYPVDRPESSGGVSGHSVDEVNGWKLSTDIGCAFMSIDGLSHYYKVTGNPKALQLLNEMAERFDKIDRYTLEAQTHCTLTAGRGFIRMYRLTNDGEWLSKAERIFKLYVEKGMTYTYQNFNWFKKGDTWTEPCAVVDSLMLAGDLFKITDEPEYRTFAARIYHNGLAVSQRPNGGAGPDTCVSDSTHELKVSLYEAAGCCSMRFAEGLWYVKENRNILYAEYTGEVTKDEFGRYSDGDLLYVEIQPEFQQYAGEPKCADGHKLYPIVASYKLPNEEECKKLSQKVIFR